MFGRTIRVNLAKPQKVKEGSTRAVWADDTWLREHAGETLDEESNSKIKDKVIITLLFIIKYFFNTLENEQLHQCHFIVTVRRPLGMTMSY